MGSKVRRVGFPLTWGSVCRLFLLAIILGGPGCVGRITSTQAGFVSSDARDYVGEWTGISGNANATVGTGLRLELRADGSAGFTADFGITPGTWPKDVPGTWRVVDDLLILTYGTDSPFHAYRILSASGDELLFRFNGPVTWYAKLRRAKETKVTEIANALVTTAPASAPTPDYIGTWSRLDGPQLTLNGDGSFILKSANDDVVFSGKWRLAGDLLVTVDPLRGYWTIRIVSKERDSFSALYTPTETRQFRRLETD